jgi:hypothetical protein
MFGLLRVEKRKMPGVELKGIFKAKYKSGPSFPPSHNTGIYLALTIHPVII